MDSQYIGPFKIIGEDIYRNSNIWTVVDLSVIFRIYQGNIGAAEVTSNEYRY